MKRILCLVWLAMLVASSAFATDARNAAMNADSWKIKDNSNDDVLPAEILGYKKVVYGELGTSAATTNDYAGVHLPVGPGLLAIYAGAIPMVSAVGLVNRSTANTAASLNVPAFNSVQAGLLTATVPAARFRVLYGLTMGAMDIAAGVDYYSDKNHDDTYSDGIGTTKFMDSSSVLNIRAGLSMPLGFIDPLSVGLLVGLPSFEGARTTANSKVDSYASTGGTDIGVNVRARLSELVGANSASYAYVSYGSGSIDATSKTQNLEQDTKTTKAGHLTAGLSNNHRVGEGSLVVWAVSYETNTQGISLADTLTPMTTGSQDTTMSALPITVAFETKLLKWLTARISSKSAVFATTATTTKITGGVAGPKPTDDTKMDTASTQLFAMGLTFAVSDKLSIDGVMQEALLFNGPYFIGGAASGVFGQVSLEYHF